MNITKKRLQEFIGLNTSAPWNEVFVEINYSPNTGIARLFIRGDRTPFYAGGYGYCKASTVLAQFLNYWVGKNIAAGCCGVGVDKVQEIAQQNGINLEYLTESKNGKIYKFSKGQENEQSMAV